MHILAYTYILYSRHFQLKCVWWLFAGELKFYQIAVGHVQRVALVGAGSCSKIWFFSINFEKSDVESEWHLTQIPDVVVSGLFDRDRHRCVENTTSFFDTSSFFSIILAPIFSWYFTSSSFFMVYIIWSWSGHVLSSRIASVMEDSHSSYNKAKLTAVCVLARLFALPKLAIQIVAISPCFQVTWHIQTQFNHSIPTYIIWLDYIRLLHDHNPMIPATTLFFNWGVLVPAAIFWSHWRHASYCCWIQSFTFW